MLKVTDYLRYLLHNTMFPLQTEDVAVKELKPNASEKDSSDFVKEVQNMIVLESKQQSRYIIKLRGVCTGNVTLSSSSYFCGFHAWADCIEAGRETKSGVMSLRETGRMADVRTALAGLNSLCYARISRAILAT